MESFVSPSARPSEIEPMPSSGRRLRHFRSISQFQSPKSKLPHISSVLSIHVLRTASVLARKKNKRGKATWSRTWLRLTSRTLSLHHHPVNACCIYLLPRFDLFIIFQEEDGYDLIVRNKISHVSRVVDDPLNCLQVITTDNIVYQFAFEQESDLYDWLTDLSPVNAPTDIEHLLHVESDKLDTSRLVVSSQNNLY
jgi:hypothetical protein